MSLSRYPQVTEELLSAYLDDLVTKEERQLIERAISEDPEIAWRLETLQQTIVLLQSLPALALPRSFAVDEEMLKAFDRNETVDNAGVLAPSVAPVQKAGWWQQIRTTLQGHGPLLRNAAAVATVLVLIFLIRNQLQPSPTTMSVSMQPPTAESIEVAIANNQTNGQAVLEQTPIRETEADLAASVGDETIATVTDTDQPTIVAYKADPLPAELASSDSDAADESDIANNQLVDSTTAESASTTRTETNRAVSSDANRTAGSDTVATAIASTLTPSAGGSNRSFVQRGDDAQSLIPTNGQQQNADAAMGTVATEAIGANSENAPANTNGPASDGSQDDTAVVAAQATDNSEGTDSPTVSATVVEDVPSLEETIVETSDATGTDATEADATEADATTASTNDESSTILQEGTPEQAPNEQATSEIVDAEADAASEETNELITEAVEVAAAAETPTIPVLNEEDDEEDDTESKPAPPVVAAMLAATMAVTSTLTEASDLPVKAITSTDSVTVDLGVASSVIVTDSASITTSITVSTTNNINDSLGGGSNSGKPKCPVDINSNCCATTY